MQASVLCRTKDRSNLNFARHRESPIQASYSATQILFSIHLWRFICRETNQPCVPPRGRGFPPVKQQQQPQLNHVPRGGATHSHVRRVSLSAGAARPADRTAQLQTTHRCFVRGEYYLNRNGLAFFRAHKHPVLCNRIIVLRTIVTRFDYTCSFPLSSEAAPVPQLQTPVIKPPVILFSGLLTQGAQVSEINLSCNTCTCG